MYVADRSKVTKETSTGVQTGVAHAVGIVGLCAMALIHFVDVFGKWHETTYIAVLFLVLIAGSLVASGLLLTGNGRAGWALGGLLAGLTLICYIVSRTWGLPGSHNDVGNWTEPLGAASMFVEGVIVVMSATLLIAGSRRSSSANESADLAPSLA